MQKTSTIDLQPLQPFFDACPSCHKDIVADQKECFSCGIIFANFEKFQFEKTMKDKVGGIDHLSNDVLRSLDQRWKRLVVNYHDQESHQTFLRRCFSEEAIPFAVYSYSRMLEIDRTDDVALVMRRQALQMMATKFEKVDVLPDSRKPAPNLLKWALWLGLFGSTLMVGVGLWIPAMHNLVGLGASLFFLFLFVQIYRRRTFI